RLADHAVAPAAVAVDNQIFAEQAKGFHRLFIAELARARHRHPVTAQQLARRRAASDPRQGFVFFAREHGCSYFLSAAAMISLARSKIGFMSPYSGFTTSKYLTPGCMRASAGKSSFGMSMRRELAGSSTSPSFCSAICPLRDKNQLRKTFAALGCGAWFIRLTEPPPAEKLEPSFQRL